ncbi:MAG: FGGY family carbohydrate kinase [Chitinophagaceae bacterium]
MLLLGIDLGTSSVKVSVVDVDTQQCLATVHYPEIEAEIISLRPGWAEQCPNKWWENVKHAILKCHGSGKYNSLDIAAIGIAYQMHGLVLVDKEQQVLRNAIIWCDSRAVDIGNKAFRHIGEEKCLTHLLNSPGNFTASKLAWVKENERFVYKRIDKIMLPGDFIAMKLTGHITTSIAALSEGMFWDYKQNELSKDIFDYYGFPTSFIPEIKEVFSEHGVVKNSIAGNLGLKRGIPVTYKAGDQPNNALSLNVFNPGEMAATAGTSGVIYSVSDQVPYHRASRVNTFAHVNYTAPSSLENTVEGIRLGVLLCINGTGIFNRWIKNIAGHSLSYEEMNRKADWVAAGSEGLIMLPFGNGAERMLDNHNVKAHIHNLDLNKHTHAHLFRAAQESVAFAFRHGLDIMRENKMNAKVIRAAKANMFLSEVFVEAFVHATNTVVELYDTDGSTGAAIGAGLGAVIFQSSKEAFGKVKPVSRIEPAAGLYATYENCYHRWKNKLEQNL